jgi:hypothetical protein
MTTPTAPASRPAGEIIAPLRELLAFALLAAVALGALHAFVDLIPAGSRWAVVVGSYPRFVMLGADFVTLLTVGAPVLAVLIAVHAGGPVARARLITLIALLELAAVAFFGLVFNVLIGFVGAASLSFIDAVKRLLAAAPLYVLLAAALLVLVRIWQGVFHVARPKPVPRPGQPAGFGQVYGQPAAPYQPPASGAPYQPPASGAPYQPPASGAPYQPPASAATYEQQQYPQQQYPPQEYAPQEYPPQEYAQPYPPQAYGQDYAPQEYAQQAPPGYGQPATDPYRQPAAVPGYPAAPAEQLPQRVPAPTPYQPEPGAPASAPPGRVYGRPVTPEEHDDPEPEEGEDLRTRMLSRPTSPPPPDEPTRQGPR